MTLREMIRSARIDKGLSLRDLGDLLIVAHTTIAQWESGSRPVPRRRLPGLINALFLDELRVRELWNAAADERDAAALAKRVL